MDSEYSGVFVSAIWYLFTLGSFLSNLVRPMMFAQRFVLATSISRMLRYSVSLYYLKTYKLYFWEFRFNLVVVRDRWSEGKRYYKRCTKIWKSHWFWWVQKDMLIYSSYLLPCAELLIMKPLFPLILAHL